MHAEEPCGEQVNSMSHLGNLSTLVCSTSSCSQSDNVQSIVVYMYSQPSKYIHHETSKPIIILYHKIIRVWWTLYVGIAWTHTIDANTIKSSKTANL